MPLGSAAKSTIDIDFTRAQGTNSTGRITFTPPRIRVGTTMISTHPVSVDLADGVGSVSLVRLPEGAYHVREEIDGRPPQDFNFVLPLSAPATIEYETIAPVESIPPRYTSIRTVNGELPNPVTGDIEIELTSTPSAHTHPSTQITDFQSAVDARVQLLVDAAPAALNTLNELAAAIGDDPDFVGTILTMLGQMQDDINELPSPAARDLIVRINDQSRHDNGNTYALPATGSEWAFLVGGPAEYTIPAAVGDDIEVSYNYLMAAADTSHLDLAVVTGAGPSIQRYLASGTPFPAFQGNAGNYPSGEGFEGRTGTLGFTVEASDIDAGLIRFRWVAKTSTADGKLYANKNYPLVLHIRNTRA